MAIEARAKGMLALAAAFALGVAAGGGVAYGTAQHQYAKILSDRRGFLDVRRMGALSRRLGLDREQRDRVRAIVEKHVGERRQLERDMFERCGDQIRAKQNEIDAEIKSVLDADQQRRFDDLSKHRNRFFRHQ